MLEIIKFRFTGTSPLLLQSERAANPFDELVRQIKTITAKGRKQTDEDRVLVGYLEFRLHLYSNGQGPYVPAINIEGMMRDAGKNEKLGKDVKKGLMCLDDAPILYQGARDTKELFNDKTHVDYRGVVLSGRRVMRCRPRFDSWSIEPEIQYDTEIFKDAETIIRIATYGGKYVSLGTYRPRFGRFGVEVLERRAPG